MATSVLITTFLVNLLGVALVVGSGRNHSATTGLIEEGFLLGCYFVLAAWLGLGLTALGSVVPARVRRGPRPLSLARLRYAGVALLAAILLVPSVITHRPTAESDAKPLADRYAQTALGELPHDAVLYVFGAELTQPLIYRQVVQHQRRDVVVVAADGLRYGWYQDQVSRRLGLRLLPASSGSLAAAARDAEFVGRFRTVYLDPQASARMANLLGYRPVGLLDQLASGHGPQSVASPLALDQTLLAAERAAGLPDRAWSRWPNEYVLRAEYAGAALEVGRAYAEHHDATGLRRVLLNVLRIDPGNTVATRAIAGSAG